MKKSAILGATTIAAVLAAGVSVPVAAFAGNSQYCSGVWVCLYKDAGYATPLGWRSAGFSLESVSPGANNQTSSWENRTGTNARWYEDQSGGGTCHTMARYSETSMSWPWEGNDNLSSWSGTAGC